MEDKLVGIWSRGRLQIPAVAGLTPTVVQLVRDRPGSRGRDNRSLSVHSLRHTFTCRLYRKGDLYLVQRALGHRQITATEMYARMNDDAVRRGHLDRTGLSDIACGTGFCHTRTARSLPDRDLEDSQ